VTHDRADRYERILAIMTNDAMLRRAVVVTTAVVGSRGRNE
jgi:hypothetical protein